MMWKHFSVPPSRAGQMPEGRRVLVVISELTGVPKAAILSRDTTQRVFKARQRVCVELRHRGWSYGRIGHLLGRDHSTIVQAVRSARG
jgi:chromosomal replication initiation ATPase DnaA